MKKKTSKNKKISNVLNFLLIIGVSQAMALTGTLICCQTLTASIISAPNWPLHWFVWVGLYIVLSIASFLILLSWVVNR